MVGIKSDPDLYSIIRLGKAISAHCIYNLRKYAERDIIDSMETRERLIQLKEETDLNWKAFSMYFGIPYRTVQDWYMGNRKMPEYLLRLMIYKVETEKLLQHNK